VRLVAVSSALLIVGLASCSSHHHGGPVGQPGASNGETRIVHYSPFDASGALKAGIRITQVKTGRCVHRTADERADMFDCTIATAHGTNENGPCFYGDATTPLVCPSGANLSIASEVHPAGDFVPPTGPVPAASSVPFALTLSNGKLCFPYPRHRVRALDVDGQSLTHICAPGQSGLYGSPDRHHGSTWTAQYRASLRGRPVLKPVTVSVAWF
jgi:hypothetical protein